MLFRLILCTLFLLLSIPTFASSQYQQYDIHEDSNGDLYLELPRQFVLIHSDISIPLYFTPKNGLLNLYLEGNAWKIRTITENTFNSLSLSQSDYHIEYIDFSNDGDVELIVRASNDNDDSFILHNVENGSVSFSTHNKSDDGIDLAQTNTISYADQNGDGYKDIIISPTDQTPEVILLGNAQDSFTNSTPNADDIADSTPSIPIMPATASASSNAAVGEEINLTAGQFRVDESGAATYSIPLALPQGIASVQPSISLNYSSAGGNGALGVGWSIGGLSAISRCRQTFEQDGNFVALNLNNEDRFCLDGQRLVVVSGVYGADGSEYRTEIASQTRIISYGSSVNGPDYFSVERADGSKAYYGNYDGGANSSPTSYLAPGGAGTPIISWMIGEFHDNISKSAESSSTNAIIFNYSALDTYGINEVVLESIDYSGNSIDFSYSNKSNDIHSGYIAGYAIEQKALLNDIFISSHLSGSSNIRSYHLTYQDESESIPSAAISAIQLTSIQECDGSSRGSCLPATEFDWQNEPQHSGTPRTASFHDTDIDNFLGMMPIDFNADGLMDIAYWYKTNDWTITLAFKTGQGDGYFSDINAPDDIDLTHYTYVQVINQHTSLYSPKAKFKVVDINGDGYQDIVYQLSAINDNPSHINNSRWWSKIYVPETGNYSDISSIVTWDFGDISFVDLTGDGLADLVSGDKVARNRKNSFAPEQTVSLPHTPLSPYTNYTLYSSTASFVHGHVADFNGDGLADVMAMVTDQLDYNDNGCTIRRTETYMQPYTQHYDGEGTSYFELYGGRMPGTAIRERYNSTGSNSNTCRSLVNDNGYGLDVRYSDINGDGLTDLVYKDIGTGRWKFYASTGISFSYEGVVPSLDEGASNDADDDAKHKQFADINADGAIDLVYHQTNDDYPNGKWFYNSFKNGVFTEQQIFGSHITIDQLDETTQTGLFLNLTGKNVSEYLKIDFENNQYHTFVDSNNPGNRIKVITNGFGLATEINYQPLTNSDVYTRGENADDIDQGRCPTVLGLVTCSPVFDVIAPNYVVASVTSDTPSHTVANSIYYDENNTVSVSYHYQGMRAQAGGRGMLGFEKITSTDHQSGIETVTTYSQEFPFIGMPIATESRNASGNLLSQATNTLSNNDSNEIFLHGGKIAFPYIKSSIEQSYSPDTSTLLSSVVTTNTYQDTEGNGNHVNLTHVTVSTYQGDIVGTAFHTTTTQNEYSNASAHNGESVTNWWLGRITKATVTHHRPSALVQPSITRVAEFEYDSNGMLFIEKANSGADVAVNINAELTTMHCYDNWGNETLTVSYANLSSTPSCDSNTAGIENNANKVFRRNITTYDNNRYVNSQSNDLFTGTQVNSRNYLGQPTQTTDINGVVTYIGYDAFGRQYFSSNSLGQTTTVSRNLTTDGGDGSYYQETTTSSGKPTVTKYFDKLGRVIRTETESFTGALIKQDSYYDSLGRVIQQSIPYIGSSASSFNITEYDEYNRVISTTAANGITSSMAYDDFEVTSTINPNDEADIQTKITTSNVLGETVSVQDNASSTAMQYQYNAVGNLIKVVGIDNVAVTTTFDDYGRKIAMNDPNKGLWTYRYNALGELIYQQSARGHITQFTRDSVGRTTLKSTSGGVNESINYTYSHNGSGHLLQTESNNLQSKNYFYDNYGRIARVQTTVDNKTFTQQTTYDQYGRVFQQFDAQETPTFACRNNNDSIIGQCWGIENQYNAQGYLQLQREARYGTSNNEKIYYQVNAIDVFGNVTEFTQNDGNIDTVKSFDPITGLVTGITATANGAVIQNNTYSFDNLGNLRSRANHTLQSGLGQSESFTYDNVNRLTHINGSEKVKYYANGNIKWKSGVGSYCYNATRPHAVSGIGSTGCTTQTYNYDNNGNMTSGRQRNIVYSHFDKATSITNTSDNSVSHFSYGTNRSRFKRITTENIDNEEITTTTYYIGNVEVVSKSNSSVITTRRNLPGAISLYRSNGTIEVNYLLNDHIGSIDTIADENGYILQKLYFDAWGKKSIIDSGHLISSLGAFTPLSLNALLAITPRGFTGHESVDHADIIHMNGRIYDPTLGRFLQADPHVQEPDNNQNLNRYSYVLNNPLSMTDPSGYFHLGKFFQRTFNKAKPFIGAIVATVATFACGLQCGQAALIAIGGMSGAMGAAANGGNIFKGAIIGAFSAAAFYEIGKAFRGMAAQNAANNVQGLSEFGGNLLTSGQITGQIASHAAAGGVISVLSGGKFGHGFVSAGFTKAAGGAILPGGSDLSNQEIIGGTIASAVIGGTASVLSGGKFANGARTAAYQYMFNQAGKRLTRRGYRSGVGSEVRRSSEEQKAIYMNILISSGGIAVCVSTGCTGLPAYLAGTATVLSVDQILTITDGTSPVTSVFGTVMDEQSAILARDIAIVGVDVLYVPARVRSLFSPNAMSMTHKVSDKIAAASFANSVNSVIATSNSGG